MSHKFNDDVYVKYNLLKPISESKDIFTKTQVTEWLKRKTYIPKLINGRNVRIIRGSSIHRELVKLAKKYFDIEVSFCESYQSDNKLYRWVILNENEAEQLQLNVFNTCERCNKTRILFIVHDTFNVKDKDIVSCPLCKNPAVTRYICKNCSNIGFNCCNFFDNEC